MDKDAISRLREALEETYVISDEQADALYELIKKLDLPPPLLSYNTFLHTDAYKNG
jgi:hypothetical protein